MSVLEILRVLFLEDNEDDAELCVAALTRAGFAPIWNRLETESDFIANLDTPVDIILADFSLPTYDGISALRLLRDRGLDTPFILISGTVGEERAVEAMRLGADDYLLKDRLARLGDAVRQAMQRQDFRRAQRQSEEEHRFLQKTGQSLTQSLDYPATLQTVVNLLVPAMADRLDLYIQQNDALKRVATANVALPEAVVWSLFPEIEIQTSVPIAVLEVLRSTNAECVVFAPSGDRVLSPDQIGDIDADEHFPPVTGMCLPLVAHGRTFGAMTLRFEQRSQLYAQSDLIVLSEVARITALAIDNALLYLDVHRALAVRDQFLSVAAHELRTPVTAIKGFADLIWKTDQVSPELNYTQRARWVGRIVEGCNRLKSLADSLLDVAYIQSGELSLRTRQVNLVELVSNTTSLCQEQHITTHRIVLDQPPQPCEVIADPDRVEQLLFSLLSNAVKFSPVGSDIHIAVEREDRGVRVTVRDEGIGILQSEEQLIFAPFGRSQSAERLMIEGSGMGLFVARTIVERHGGRIWAKSAGENRGTTVGFWLPGIQPGKDEEPLPTSRLSGEAMRTGLDQPIPLLPAA